MKKVLVLFSLALIQGCLVSNKEFEELDSDSSFFTSVKPYPSEVILVQSEANCSAEWKLAPYLLAN